jgi:predicted hotdog family 3-hydroxylacyl-ACP dehydratase
LIPHQFGMCLLDSVLRWDERSIRAQTDSHRRPNNPLRHADQLAALHLCEYGAQSMAVHGGLLAARSGGRARPGMLVSLRGVELHCARIDDLAGTLDVGAEVLIAGADSWQYQFHIEHAGQLLASGRAAVMLKPEESA